MTVTIAWRERRLRLPIRDQLDSTHEPRLTDLTNVTMCCDRHKRVSQDASLLFNSTDDGAIRQKAERRQRSGATQCVSGVRVTVEKVAVLVVSPEECVVDAIRSQCCCY